MRKWKAEAASVLYERESAAALSRRDVDALAARAVNGARIRLCLHKNAAAQVHEMLIVLRRGEYVHPHKHRGHPETYLVVEGRAAFFEFDARGAVTRRVLAGPAASGRVFLYRQRPGRYHSLVVLSKRFVFQETKAGPFRRAETRNAPWAPPAEDSKAARAFVARLRSEAVKGRAR